MFVKLKIRYQAILLLYLQKRLQQHQLISQPSLWAPDVTATVLRYKIQDQVHLNPDYLDIVVANYIHLLNILLGYWDFPLQNEACYLNASTN
ncbi:hypothetical protein TNIN_156751 [Trichonephila inaurata madagascariensis]|uniref:Uncharacterized protein n=1 Tax=Trichonephila inaurata madagascariensis TaxID=2747483 RepID=A0A8X7C4V5_9ARAC|nr:hypothetical protein TNIN_156751 [Trichonephila inaurata madagascariensis]